MIRRPPRSTLDRSSAASDVYKRQGLQVGKAIEELDIADLEAQLAFVTNPGLINIYTNLKAGSVSHLAAFNKNLIGCITCLLYTSPSPRDRTRSRMPSSA